MYEAGSFGPSAKIIGRGKFSIINDYIGRPIQVYSETGELVWETEYDIYGGLRNLKGDRSFIPFRQLGQYEDIETGLYYNRFRYYNTDSGIYLSQDPIGIAGNNPNLYGYVYDTNSQADLFGLDCQVHHIIPQAVYKRFPELKKMKGYVQAVNHRVAQNRNNLIELETPFHGNHPKYNEFVTNELKSLKEAGKLDLDNVSKLQNTLRDQIAKAQESGLNLNDFFANL
ncbi:RHS repeat-associated core domain-containing protein [Flavobacterium sp. T12S277]|uniref:RHS repeat-associated core domain-containing protein n=1 Tax=Flavobacterium sp. T12S277 TaxID=3402752 RepID=UPI003AEC4675